MKGVPAEKIRQEYPNRGATLTKAIQKFLKWAPPHLNELLEKIAPLESKAKELQGNVGLLIKENSERVNTSLKLKETNQNLQMELEKVKGEIEERNTVFEHLKELTDRDVPFELIQRFSELEFESTEELTSRIKTLEAYKSLVEDKENLEEAVENLEKNKAKAEKELDKLKEETTYQRNELDAEKAKTRSYREAVETTCGFFEDGYSFTDLNSLRSGLKAVAIKEKPQISLSRLMNGIQNSKSLSHLTDLIEEETERLKPLTRKSR